MINVLDHGYVRLVDYMGSDLSIVRAARVSYDAAWRAGEDEDKDTKLINYLWKNKHTTPFESVTFTFEVYAPIFVLRQWHRHRTWSYNELSGRYKELEPVFYTPNSDQIGMQDTKNKQARTLGYSTDPYSHESKEYRSRQVSEYKEHCEVAFVTYKYLLNQGWPRELARMVLPLSTYSHMFATVNLLNLFKFITLRSDSHAQYEIQVYSDAMLKLIEPIVPVTHQTFTDNNWK